jgi:hypothetical protein
MNGPLKAYWMLAWAFLRTLLRRWLGLRRDGLRRFKDNYFGEGLTPYSSDERALLGAFSGCVACGRCNRALATGSAAGTSAGLMGLVLASTRSSLDLPGAAAAWESLSDEELETAEELCPPALPLVQLRRYVLSRTGPGREGRDPEPEALRGVR